MRRIVGAWSGGEDDRGAVAPLVAILMVVLIGFAAISVDIGANYAEKRQLQNGADAAALAVAQESYCGNSSPTVDGVALIKANVNRGTSDGAVIVDKLRRSVTATATAVDTDGLSGRRNWFAPILGHDRTQISASATASCGSPLAGTAALPLTFNECHFTQPGVKILVAYNTKAQRCNDTSGNAAPGNFGWLKSTADGCGALISTEIYRTPGKPGNSFPGACQSVLQSLRNGIAYIPIYDDVGGNGANAWFHIVGFAAFKILGYRFSGNPALNWQNAAHPGLTCTGSCRGIIGEFVETVSLDSEYVMGGRDFGVSVVSLVR